MDFLEFQVLEVVPKPSRKVKKGAISAFTDFPDRKAGFHVWLFGRTAAPKNESVAIRLTGFNPFFYVKVPRHWGPSQIKRFVFNVTDKLSSMDRADMLEPETVRKMDMYGFRNFELDSFVKFQFRTEQARNACKYVVKDICKTIAPDMETYEANVSADMQLASTIGLVSWVRAPYIHLKPLAGQTKCHHTFDLHYDHAICLPESDAVAPMRIMSVDIETASSNMRQSDPERDCVFQIAACLRTVSGTSDDSERHLFALAPCVLDANKSQAPVEFALHVFNTEDEILLAFAQLVSDSDPDIITGWNVDGFDYHYLFTRAKANGCLREFSKRLARCLSNELYPSIVPEEFKTRAFGSSTFHRLYCPGRINLDLLFYSRRTDKFDSYKLDRVAKEVLGLDKGKLEVSYMQMWKAFEANDAVTMGEVAKYCIWDAELVLLIAIANDVWLRLLEQSRVTFVPIAQLGSRGEQIKTFSQLLRYGHEEGYLLPDETFQKANDLFVGAGGGADWATGDAAAADEERDESGPGPLIDDAVSYSGGYVLDPIVGAYFDFPVNVFDFQSLYPSIIRAHRLCFTSWVFDDATYGAVPGLEYKVIEIGGRSYKFCQHERTILPKLQNLLFAKRKAVKELLKKETDPFQKRVLDARQLGLKISMNASYGFLAANRLKCKPIGESITAVGRSMIQETKAYIETHVPNATVVYGDTDSVFFYVKGTSLGEFDCEGLAQRITEELFRSPIKLEYEKSFLPLILQAKKRYLGIKFDAGKLHLPGKRDSKGDVLQRRDVPLAVKELYDKMCDLILEKRQLGVSESIALLRVELDKIVKGQMDVSRLAVTRQMTKPISDYASTKSHLPHVEVAKKKVARGEQVESNERIQIVIMADPPGAKPTPEWSRAESLDYVIAHNRSYCILYYISTYETPVKNLLSSMAPTSAIDYVFKKALAEAKRVSQGNRAITSFFERKRVASGEGEEASGGGKRKK